MNVPTNDAQRLQAFHRVRNLTPSRDKIEDLRRIAQYTRQACENEHQESALNWMPSDCHCHEDATILDSFADILLDIRQAVRGGTKELKGSRHWTEL